MPDHYRITQAVSPCRGGRLLLGTGKFPQVWLSLVDILFIFGQEHRCLHDQLAGTWVINEYAQARNQDDEP
ncbi:MAG: hypothetical protein KJ077_13795 [Anaerolineae bacterium]|nr:hypothetical protein [Anaerolineae bacterium]